MPTLTLTANSRAPVEEVWKLLHDPARFPEWWEGVESVVRASDGDFTLYPDGYPDFPMAQRLDTDRRDGRVTISCLVSDIVFRWQLYEAGETTDILVEVEIPEQEIHRVADQRRQLDASLRALAVLASDSS